MKKYLLTPIGRLRLLGFLEGLSFVALVFIAMPIKYMQDNPSWVKTIGPIHGALFIGFVLLTIQVAIEQGWPFGKITWKLLVASVLPFGTFYVDKTILKPLADQQ